MHVRIVRPQIKPGQAQEAARRWEAFMGPKAKANPNLQAGYMAVNADGTALVAVTLWDELPSADMTKQIQKEIADQMEGLMTGPPSTEDYEVLGQI